ncbi:MAG: hypothetical protein CSA74_04275 [Rhodobacterales bacterium]|nr:MAG: hypothetical protein CSA74_04275 [Rhodobacterales bacterium]
MAYLLLSMVLLAATLRVAAPVLASGNLWPQRLRIEARGVVVLILAISAGALLLGTGYALGLLAAGLVKAAGHLVGQRLAGDDDADFRLVPFPRGPEATGTRPRDDLASFFILLMGPGLGLAPMVAAFALSNLFAETAPGLAEALRSYALAAGALNFVSLLPLWPLAGGRLVQILVEARFPRVSGLAGAAFAAMFLGMSLTMQSLLLLLVGLTAAGALMLVPPPQPGPRPGLTRAEARLGLLAYGSMLSAYLLAGWWVLTLLPASF